MARSKIARNTIFLAVSGVASVLFTALQLALLSRYLGGEQFGFFVSLRGLSLLLATVILLGLPQVLVRFLPTFAARGYSRHATSIYLASAIVVLALGTGLFLLSGNLQRLLPMSIRAFPGWTALAPWVVLSSVTLALKMLLYGAFSGLRDMRVQMFLELAFLLMFTAYMLYARDSMDVDILFEVMFVLNGAVFLFGSAIYLKLVRSLLEKDQVAREGVVVPNFFAYWAGSIALSIVALAFTDVDRFVVSSILPMTAISLFHIASRIDTLLKRFLGLPILAAQPEITRVYEEGRWADIAANIGLFTKGLLATALVCTALSACVGRDVILFLSGRSYIGAYRIFLVLLPTVPIAAISAPLLTAMRSLHFMKWAVLCDFLWMVSYFGAFFYFARALGAEGMAVSQVLASIVQMSAAIILAKKEGFFRGIGSKIGNLAIVLLPIMFVCMLAAYRFTPYASIVLIVLAPFATRALLRRLRIFNNEEIRSILGLIDIQIGKRLVSWVLSAEGQ